MAIWIAVPATSGKAFSTFSTAQVPGQGRCTGPAEPRSTRQGDPPAPSVGAPGPDVCLASTTHRGCRTPPV